MEKTFKGFKVAQKLDKMGWRGSPTAELVFDDMAVPAENLVGEVNGGVAVVMSGLDIERVLTKARLPAILDHIRPGTLVYTHYVRGIVDDLRDAVCARLAERHAPSLDAALTRRPGRATIHIRSITHWTRAPVLAVSRVHTRLRR